jgi:hypothetical protein
MALRQAGAAARAAVLREPGEVAVTVLDAREGDVVS